MPDLLTTLARAAPGLPGRPAGGAAALLERPAAGDLADRAPT